MASPFGDPNLIDCAQVACSVLVGGPQQFANVLTSVAFTDVPRDLPELTATLDGDSYGTAAVTGARFEPGENYVLHFCGPTLSADCLEFSLTPVTADASGNFSAAVPVARASNSPGDGFDCLLENCVVVARRSFVRVTDTPMVFPEPTLSLSIGSAGTLMAGTNFADVASTVTCDQSTPLSFTGTISQPVGGSPEIAGGYALDDLFCTQGEPLKLFLPTRDLSVTESDYVLGDATVEMSVTPYRAFAHGPLTTETGTAVLYDFDGIAAAITALLEDPANEAFRQQFIAAIRARVAQDPIFRAEFIALLRAG